jgi:enoyl-CoA hydratase
MTGISTQPPVLFERMGKLGLMTLNRPKALNALNMPMIELMHEQLDLWEADPEVTAVLARGAGDRAYCAGGDLKDTWQAMQDPELTWYINLFRREYRLDWRIKTYPKPFVAVIDGIVMGGGAGVSVNGAFRVATERTRFAMPECSIGIYPDVGATWFMSHFPGKMGLFMGLTSLHAGGADAHYLGAATHYVTSGHLHALTEALVEASQTQHVLPAVKAALDRCHETPPQSHLAPLQEAIDRVFSKPSLPGILEALAKEEGGWAADARQQVARNSPFSLAVCHRQLTTAEGLSFEDCMRREFAMSLRFGKEADFREGMRAQIVDKDRNPTWRHASISKIDQAEIDAIFAPLTTVPGLALGQ